MLATSSAELPLDQGEYQYEWKWDGIRAMAYLDRKGLELESRNQHLMTSRYPELQALRKSTRCRSAIFDGEIVALDESAMPSFRKLQQRMHVDAPSASLINEVPIWYMVFDLLYCDGKSLMNEPYSVRRDRLEACLDGGAFWRISARQSGGAVAMMHRARTLHLEGIVAKRSDGIYEPGRRSSSWLKIKTVRRQELVIGGWIAEDSGRSGRVGAMLMGYYDGAALHYAGRIGTGLNQSDHERLSALFKKYARAASPFSEKVPGHGVHFLKPALIAEVEYRRWPQGGLVQQGAFKGVRFDKNPRTVVKEPIARDNQTG